MLEISAFVATIIGLAGIFYQLVMLRLDMRLNAERNVINSERELWTNLLENPNIAPNLLTEYVAGTERTTEAATEILFITLIFGHYEMIYREHSNGVVSDAVWDSMSAALISTLEVPLVKQTWQEWKAHYDREFILFVDQNLKEPPK